MRRSIRIIGLAVLGAALLAAPASAARPQQVREQVDNLFVDDFLSEACGVTITGHVTGHAIFRLFTDAQGAPIRELNNYAFSVRFASDSASIFAKDVGVDRVTYLADGSLIQVVIGSVQSFSSPGMGRVYADVGQRTMTITFDGNGDPVFDLVSSHGQHDDDQVDVICSILAA